MDTRNKRIQNLIIISFLCIPILVSIISTIHTISFFELSNYYYLALTLALSFEIGSLAALAGLVALDKIQKNVVWFIFILLTLMQMIGNVYFAYDYVSIKMIKVPDLIKNFTELFGLDILEDVVTVKRIIAIITGGILPIISLSFLDLLISFVKKSQIVQSNSNEPLLKGEELKEEKNITTITTNVESEGVLNSLSLEEEEIKKFIKNKEDFETVLQDKKKQIDKDRKDFTELLRILFKDGEIIQGKELPSYNEFVKMVDEEDFSTDDVKRFLTFCNYLNISKVSNDSRLALKSYDESIKILQDYLSLNLK